MITTDFSERRRLESLDGRALARYQLGRLNRLLEAAGLADFDEWNFQNDRAKLAQFAGERPCLMAGAAYKDSDSPQRRRAGFCSVAQGCFPVFFPGGNPNP